MKKSLFIVLNLVVAISLQPTLGFSESPVIHAGPDPVAEKPYEENAPSSQPVPRRQAVISLEGESPLAPVGPPRSVIAPTPKKDTTPPVVSSIRPAPYSPVKGNTTLSALVIDQGGVAKVEFWVDNKLIGLGTRENGYRYSISWDTTKVENGSHGISIRAYDKSGNLTTVPSFKVLVDNPKDTTPPEVIVTKPKPYSTVTGATTLEAAVLDKDSGVDRVEFWVDNKLIGLGTRKEGNRYAISWNTSSAENGSHGISIRAYDKSENLTTVPTFKVLVNNPKDTTPPEVTFIRPIAYSTVKGTTTLEASVRDRDSSVNRVEFWVDNKLIGVGTRNEGNRYSISWDTTKVENGSHGISIRAYDTAGNLTSIPTFKVLVDNSKKTAAPGTVLWGGSSRQQ